MWESYGALATVVLTAIGLFLTARRNIRADKRQKNIDAQALLDKAIADAKKPLEDRIAELTTDHASDMQEAKERADADAQQARDRIKALQDSQVDVIANAVAYWKNSSEQMERDRDYWRREARGENK